MSYFYATIMTGQSRAYCGWLDKAHTFLFVYLITKLFTAITGPWVAKQNDMKKFLSTLLPLVMIAVGVGFAGCGNDDDSEPVPSWAQVDGKSIVGTWVSPMTDGTHTYCFMADGTGFEEIKGSQGADRQDFNYNVLEGRLNLTFQGNRTQVLGISFTEADCLTIDGVNYYRSTADASQSPEYLIVGTWECQPNKGGVSYRYVLRADGTGIETYMDDGYCEDARITYRIEGSRIYFTSSLEDPFSREFHFENRDCLVMDGQKFYRQ